jgi:hypothetical protein
MRSPRSIPAACSASATIFHAEHEVLRLLKGRNQTLRKNPQLRSNVLTINLRRRQSEANVGR